MTGTSRRHLLKLAAALPAGALGGCIVTPYGPYHRPSADHPDVRYKGAWCNGVAGPKSVIELTLAPGLVLTAVAQREYMERNRPDLPLRLTLRLPATPLRFADANLRVTARDQAIGSAAQIRVSRYARLPASEWIDPARTRPSGTLAASLDDAAPHGSASVGVALPVGFAPDRIVVDGLVIEQAGRRFAMPPVEMTRPASARSTSDYRSAAMQAQLQARADACRRDTPQRNCAAIVDHGQHSFELNEPDGRFRGRWYRFDGRANQPINGGIEIALRKPERWRPVANSVTVTDVSSGERRTAQFTEVGLALNDRVPLDAPLFAGAVDGSGDARMSIEVLLPAGTGDFELRLPALLLGERRIEVPLLRFDQRVIDGGVEPFNC